MTDSKTQRFRLTIAYDGTAYAGWQVQPGDPTVQETIETVLRGLVGAGQEVKLHGSGRTDQGVHAHGQVAHVDLQTRMDAPALLRALNSRLPPDIRVLRARNAAADFPCAPPCAKSKEYRYFVWNGPILPPERRLYAAHMPTGRWRWRPCGRRRSIFVGEHDFASFTANPNRVVECTVRQVTMCAVRKQGPRICFRVRGGGFLYKQVRSMVGFLLRVGEGAEPPEAVAELLRHRAPRTARVPTAAPQGLFLWQVWY
jgi:tRNA pseudouridine38-40 synthase